MATDDPQYDESYSTQNTALTVLRWIVFIPAALLACVVGRFLVVLINRWGMSRYGERRYSNFLESSGLWFQEYKHHWIWLIVALFGGALGVKLFDFIASFFAAP